MTWWHANLGLLWFLPILDRACWLLWNSFIREAKIINVWKSAHVSPFSKVEVRKDPRPISSTLLFLNSLVSRYQMALGKNLKQNWPKTILDQWMARLLYMHWWSFYITVTTLQMHPTILFGSFIFRSFKAFNPINHQIVLQNCLIWEPQHSCFIGLWPS